MALRVETSLLFWKAVPRRCAGGGCSPHPGVQQQVVWFDVSVDEAQLVDGVDGQHRLSDIELRGLFRQRVLLHQQRHHVSYRRGNQRVTELLAFAQSNRVGANLQAGTP